MIGIIIVGYLVFQIIMLGVMFENATIEETDFKPLYSGWGTPKYIYDNTNCNMFGCVLITLLGIVLIPLYYIIYFIYFICHIGRE